MIEKAADSASGFDSFRAELEKPVSDWLAGKIAECTAATVCKARASDDAEFAKGE